MSFAKEVYERLSKVDISKKVEKKNNLNYLSWVNCWAYLMIEYPESRYEAKDTIFHPDGSAEVGVQLMVWDDEEMVQHSMWLAVFDYKNKAIINPNSVDISNSKMRCLVKCAAMFGLGLELYSGEDLPKSKPVFNSKSPTWSAACNSVRERKTRVEQLENKYNISEEDKVRLEILYAEGLQNLSQQSDSNVIVGSNAQD